MWYVALSEFFKCILGAAKRFYGAQEKFLLGSLKVIILKQQLDLTVIHVPLLHIVNFCYLIL
jgi:hypothetical protein